MRAVLEEDFLESHPPFLSLLLPERHTFPHTLIMMYYFTVTLYSESTTLGLKYSKLRAKQTFPASKLIILGILFSKRKLTNTPYKP